MVQPGSPRKARAGSCAKADNFRDQVVSMDEGHPTPPAPLTVGELQAQVDRLIAEGRAEQAIALAETFLDKAEKQPLHWRKIIYADVLNKAGRRTDAIACLRSVEANLPALQQLRLATLLLQEGQPAAAVMALPGEAALREASQNSVQHLLAYLRVLTAGGHIAQARDLLQALHNDLTVSHPIHLWMVFGGLSIELAMPALARLAVEHAFSASDLTAEQLAISIFRLQCTLTGDTGADAIEPLFPQIERQLALLGWPRDASVAYAKCLSAAGWHQKADSVLDRDFEGAETDQFLMQRILTKAELKDRQATIALARSALAGSILHPDTRSRLALLLSGLLVEDGMLEEAIATLEAVPGYQDKMEISRDLFILKRALLPPKQAEQLRTELAAAEKAKLPSALKAALSEIAPRPRASPMRTFGHIRELWHYQGHGIEHWDDWRSRFDWGRDAIVLLRQWVLFADEDKKQELRDLLAPVDTGPLDMALAEGRGAIIVGTHMGPVSAAFFFVEQLDHPFRFIGNGGTPSRTKSEGIELAVLTRTQSVRQSVAHLKKGGVLGILTDVVNAGGFEVLELKNLRVRVATLPARLSWKLMAPTVWCQSEWVDGKLQVSFLPLPQRLAGETEEAFVGRWLCRHKEILQARLQGAPENLPGLKLFSDSNAEVSIASALTRGPARLGQDASP